MSYQPPFTINAKIIDLVSLISEKIGQISTKQKEPFKLRKESRIKTLAGTLQIEGNTLDEEKITALLEGKRVLGTIREVAEAKGAIELYDKISEFDYMLQDDLLKSHQILMQELIKDNGHYRQSNVGVGSEEVSGDTGESTPFIEYMLNTILETIKDAEQKSIDVPKNVPKDVPLNRLVDIIKLISENRDITKLKEQNRLKRVGSLKSGYWKVLD